MDSTAPATASPLLAEFMPDTRAVATALWSAKTGWAAKLAGKQASVHRCLGQRAAFHAAYDGLDERQLRRRADQHTRESSFTDSERDALVSGLTSGIMTRAEVLRQIAENERFVSAKRNETFVMMEYFGYLRRDPDADGLRILAQQAEPVRRQLRTGGNGQGVHRLW